MSGGRVHVALLKLLFHSGFKAPFPADDINPKNVPRRALAEAALSFRAHLRPLSMRPPAEPALGTAIPLLPLGTGTRNPRFHQRGEMERPSVGRPTNYYNYYCFVLEDFFGGALVFLEDFFEGLNFSILLSFLCAWWSFLGFFNIFNFFFNLILTLS